MNAIKTAREGMLKAATSREVQAFKELARLRKDHPDIFEKARTVSAATAPAVP